MPGDPLDLGADLLQAAVDFVGEIERDGRLIHSSRDRENYLSQSWSRVATEPAHIEGDDDEV
jgi:hypothetical protein